MAARSQPSVSKVVGVSKEGFPQVVHLLDTSFKPSAETTRSVAHSVVTAKQTQSTAPKATPASKHPSVQAKVLQEIISFVESAQRTLAATLTALPIAAGLQSVGGALDGRLQAFSVCALVIMAMSAKSDISKDK